MLHNLLEMRNLSKKIQKKRIRRMRRRILRKKTQRKRQKRMIRKMIRKTQKKKKRKFKVIILIIHRGKIRSNSNY
jgi:hypothetical protein